MSLFRSIQRKRISLRRFFLRIILLLLIAIFIFLLYQIILTSTSILIETDLSPSMKRIYQSLPSKIPSVRCIIYISRRSGRLGNRMFVIATAYAFARLHSCHLYLSPIILEELTSIFVFTIESILLSEMAFRSIRKNITHTMNKITKDIGCEYLPKLLKSNGIPSQTVLELRGFWQNHFHFVNYSAELKQNIFIGTQSLLERVSQFFSGIYQQHFNIQSKLSFDNHHLLKKQLSQFNQTTWIGVHIRRTDFFGTNVVSSDEYILNALEYYILRYPNAYFIVASDDKSYCKDLFHDRTNIILTPSKFSPGDDLITLSVCEHSLITGGTFGWWSAYLANGEVVHDSAYDTYCENDRYYYPSWFKDDIDILLYKHNL